MKGTDSMKNGIIVAGSTIADYLKKIDIYPGESNLTAIRKVDIALGGLVCNCGQDLARLDPELRVTAVGIVGDDDAGKLICEVLGKYPNIDVSGIIRRGQTSFTDVMYDSERKTRTFFHFNGADAEMTPEDFDFDAIKGDILHIGYALLLDSLDAPHPVYGTNLAAVLHSAQEKGIKTSMDIVSEESDRYRTIVVPALKYVDYCIVNETEASRTTGIPAADENGRIIESNMPLICRELRRLGVKDRIIIHAKPASYGLDTDGTYYRMDCIDVPKSMIVSTTGAGDAFCSGALYGIYRGMSMRDTMYFATGVASCSLTAANASDGVVSYEKTLGFMKKYPVPDCIVVR
ncbi:MAG: carbohydrate kinase family protein [Clostridia bacterium]|nr:carbohydrate kinase family protein [Clostridia bacterium]MBR5768111.1 carbohydrate kinase family protein [Clostridia bacterium]